MQKYEGSRFQAADSWRGPNVARIPDADVKLRWINTPYRWHANTGEEVFVVLSGVVDMHVRKAGRVEVVELSTGDMLHISAGEEHVAHPRGEARVLVVEQADVG